MAAAIARVQKEVHYVAVIIVYSRRAGYQPSSGAAGLRPRPRLPGACHLLGA